MARRTKTQNLEIPRCAIAHLRFALRAPRNDGSSVQPHSGGTGMGLAIVRAMLDAHGGAVRLVESENGTAFELTFPVTDAAAS